MNKSWGCSSVAFLVLLAAAPAIDVAIEYERYPDERKGYRPHGYGTVPLQLTAPAGEWRLPKLKSKQPLFGFVEFVDGKRLVIFDRRKKSDKFFSRVYFDSNGNRDLTDDAEADAEGRIHKNRERPYGSVQFPAFDTTVTVEAQALPFSFRLRISGSLPKGYENGHADAKEITRSLRAGLMLNCFYKGVLRSAGRTYRLALADRNCNGVFNDPFTIRELDYGSGRPKRLHGQGDGLYVSTAEKFSYHDGELLGDLLLIEDALYRVSIDLAAGRMTLSPVEKSLSPLRLAAETRHLVAYTKDKKHCVFMVDPGAVANLPEGEYRLLSYRAERTGPEGDKWMIKATGTGDGAFAAAKGTPGGLLNFGEPYTPMVSVPGWGRNNRARGGKMRLEFIASGIGGERVSDLSRLSGSSKATAMSLRDKRRPKEPSYKILAADGEVVAQGDFEYG